VLNVDLFWIRRIDRDFHGALLAAVFAMGVRMAPDAKTEKSTLSMGGSERGTLNTVPVDCPTLVSAD
jgi:hypothetical protein